MKGLTKGGRDTFFFCNSFCLFPSECRSFRVANSILLTDHFEGMLFSLNNQIWKAARREEGRRLWVREVNFVDRESKKTLLFVQTPLSASFVILGNPAALNVLPCQLGIIVPSLHAHRLIEETRYVAERHHTLKR